MTLIFALSSQPAEESSQTSRLAAKLLYSISPSFRQLPPQEQQTVIENTQMIVRKGAHFSAYAGLGVLLTLAYGKKPVPGWVTAVLYAGSDELHQRFVPGRSGELRDVLIDSSGALTGILVLFLVLFLIKFVKNRSFHRKNMVKKEK